MKTGISERENRINRNINQFSVVTVPRINYSHEFDWNIILILEKESHYNKILILEAIYI